MNSKILIVEDEAKLREILCDYFSSKGELPVEASNGIQALELIDENEFDAVLLDIMMPELDGLSVCRAVRRTNDVPIIFLTALSDEEDKLLGYELGADDYIMLNMSEDRPLANKNLRFALNYAINRTEYNKLVNNDVYDVAQRLVLPNVQAADDQTYGEAYPYTPFPAENDNDKAKEYLDAAMKEMGVSNPADIKITLLTTDTDGAKKQAEVLQEQYQKNLGITVEINQVTYKQRLELETKKDYDMVVTGWVPDYSDAYSYLELWISDGQYNHSGYANAEYDKLLKDSQTETDAKTRQDMLFQAEKIFLEEDSALVPLQLRRDQYLINPKISNFNVYFRSGICRHQRIIQLDGNIPCGRRGLTGPHRLLI